MSRILSLYIEIRGMASGKIKIKKSAATPFSGNFFRILQHKQNKHR